MNDEIKILNGSLAEARQFLQIHRPVGTLESVSGFAGVQRSRKARRQLARAPMIKKRITVEPEIELTADELLAEIRSRNCLDQLYCLRELGNGLSDERLRELRAIVGEEAWAKTLRELESWVSKIRSC